MLQCFQRIVNQMDLTHHYIKNPTVSMYLKFTGIYTIFKSTHECKKIMLFRYLFFVYRQFVRGAKSNSVSNPL